MYMYITQYVHVRYFTCTCTCILLNSQCLQLEGNKELIGVWSASTKMEANTHCNQIPLIPEKPQTSKTRYTCTCTSYMIL